MNTNLDPEEVKEQIEHQNALLAIRAILGINGGREFFKYLFRSLDVGELPELGLEGTMLFEKLGFMRAGNSIFKLVAEADAGIAGSLLAQIQKERYANTREG